MAVLETVRKFRNSGTVAARVGSSEIHSGSAVVFDYLTAAHVRRVLLLNVQHVAHLRERVKGCRAAEPTRDSIRM